MQMPGQAPPTPTTPRGLRTPGAQPPLSEEELRKGPGQYHIRRRTSRAEQKKAEHERKAQEKRQEEQEAAAWHPPLCTIIHIIILYNIILYYTQYIYCGRCCGVIVC